MNTSDTARDAAVLANEMPRTCRYDAFFSYSHDPRQSAITAALQQSVQRFAKPFWKRRAVSIFRDQTNLSANPDLWGVIVDALGASRYFVLVASPRAAQSPWVAREVDWWLRHRNSDTIIIVLADGSLVWDGDQFSDSMNAALSPSAQTAFGKEPLWLDLTGLAVDPGVGEWRQSPCFLDAVASISSYLRGIEKQDLIGEDLKRHRQTRRAISATIATIGTLLIIAIAAAIFAEWKRRDAVLRANEATAALIWSRLDFEAPDDPGSQVTVRALWDLATQTDGVRSAFLRHMQQDLSRVVRLAQGPRMILRAFGLRPKPDVAAGLFDPLLEAIRSTPGSPAVSQLAYAIEAIGPYVTPNLDHSLR